VLLRKDAENGTFDPEYHEQYNSVSGKVALLGRLQHVETRRLRGILRAIPPTYDVAKTKKIKKLVGSFCKKPLDRTKLGYIKKFYKLQHAVAVIKQTDQTLAKALQGSLNKVRPVRRLRDAYE
jgi:hypothetical protein